MDANYDDLPKTWTEYRKLRKKILSEELGIEEAWFGDIPLDSSTNIKNYPLPNEEEIKERTITFYQAMKNPNSTFKIEKRIQTKYSPPPTLQTLNKPQNTKPVMETISEMFLIFFKWFVYSFLFFFTLNKLEDKND